jgi:hypothetical protein
MNARQANTVLRFFHAWQTMHQAIKGGTLMEMLDTSDSSTRVTDTVLAWWGDMLNEVFFFGALKNFDIVWSAEGLQDQEVVGGLGLTISDTLDSRRNHNPSASHPFQMAEKYVCESRAETGGRVDRDYIT